jgi:hypothetical protein
MTTKRVRTRQIERWRTACCSKEQIYWTAEEALRDFYYNFYSSPPRVSRMQPSESRLQLRTQSGQTPRALFCLFDLSRRQPAGDYVIKLQRYVAIAR